MSDDVKLSSLFKKSNNEDSYDLLNWNLNPALKPLNLDLDWFHTIDTILITQFKRVSLFNACDRIIWTFI